MSSQVDQSGRLCLCHKLFIQICVSCYEYNVHDRTVFESHRVFVQAAGVYIIIEHLRLFSVASFHGLKSACGLDMFEHFSRYVYSEARRSIIHRIIVGMYLIVEVARAFFSGISDQILSHYGYGDSRRAYVLLRSCPDDPELAHIYLLRQYVGGHIGYQRNISCLGNIVICRSVDGVIGSYVDIVRIASDVVSAELRHPCEGVLLGGGYHIYIAETAGLFIGFFSPRSRYSVIGFTAFSQEIQRDHRKLESSSAL